MSGPSPGEREQPSAPSDPRSPCGHCRADAGPVTEMTCFCAERCAAARCEGGFRIVGCAVSGERHLVGRSGALIEGERAPAGEGTVFATAAEVRRYVREHLNDVSPRYWQVKIVDRDGYASGLGTRAGWGWTGNAWSWSGSVET